MALAPRQAQFRRAVRGFYAWIASFLLALVVPILAEHFIAAPDSATRAWAVAVGTAAWLPLFAVVIWVIRAGDEYTRQLHLTAAAVAFLATLLLLLPLSWLEAAHLLRPPSLQMIWTGAAVLWAVSLFVVKYRFERRT